MAADAEDACKADIDVVRAARAADAMAAEAAEAKFAADALLSCVCNAAAEAADACRTAIDAC